MDTGLFHNVWNSSDDIFQYWIYPTFQILYTCSYFGNDRAITYYFVTILHFFNSHTHNNNKVKIYYYITMATKILCWPSQAEYIYVTWSREMSHLSKISISIFLLCFLITSICFMLMQTPLQLDIWLQSYEWFDNAKNDMKQRDLNTVFANI